jgi:tetratricopeptide (TPR) repeat protein
MTRLAPKYSWNNKGAALFSQGENEEAITAYDEAIRLAPYYAAVAATWSRAPPTARGILSFIWITLFMKHEALQRDGPQAEIRGHGGLFGFSLKVNNLLLTISYFRFVA